MNFNLQLVTSAPSQQYQSPMNSGSMKPRAVFVEPTGHIFGQDEYPTWQNSQVSLYNGSYSDSYHQNQPFYNFNDTYHIPVSQNYTYVPPDPFCTVEEPQPLDQEKSFKSTEFPVQDKEQILEEIVRECNEIERRSMSSKSPVSSWSSDEHDSSETRSYHPYKTPEKKERKKAQNRLAATRYREKKRREKEEAMTCIEGLSGRNAKLKDQVSELEREIRYFKKFMREMGMKNLETLA